MNNLVVNLMTSPISTLITLPFQITCAGVNLGLYIVSTPVSLGVSTIENCIQNNKNKKECKIEEDNFNQELVDINLSNTSRV